MTNEEHIETIARMLLEFQTGVESRAIAREDAANFSYEESRKATNATNDAIRAGQIARVERSLALDERKVAAYESIAESLQSIADKHGYGKS